MVLLVDECDIAIVLIMYSFGRWSFVIHFIANTEIDVRKNGEEETKEAVD